MAIVGIRKLTREHKEIIEQLQRTKEPVLITNQGKPVAALVPVDETNAERFLVAAHPDVAPAFRDAADVETQSIEDLMAEHGDEAEAPREEGLAPVEAVRRALMPDATKLFGEEVGAQFAERAAAELATMAATATGGFAKADPGAVGRIAMLNAELFRTTLLSVAPGALAEIVGSSSLFEKGTIGPAFADAALRRASERVGLVNRRIAAHELHDAETYAITLATAIDVLGTGEGPMRTVDITPYKQRKMKQFGIEPFRLEGD
jgi:prevent-host-death family protein